MFRIRYDSNHVFWHDKSAIREALISKNWNDIKFERFLKRRNTILKQLIRISPVITCIGKKLVQKYKEDLENTLDIKSFIRISKIWINIKMTLYFSMMVFRKN